MEKVSTETEKTEEKKNVPIKKTSDLIKLKLDKLMQNIEKPVVIPERPKLKNAPNVPDFVRNVMGSSAGAGSGEFHVYRHLRRKEYARMKFIQNKSELELLDEAYHNKLAENKRKAEELTLKKRAKRLKRKEKKKINKKIKKENPGSGKDNKSDSSEESEADEIPDNQNINEEKNVNTELKEEC